MDIMKRRTADLFEEVKSKIESGNLTTVDTVAEAIVKGAEERCLVFGEMKEAATFQMMGEIDSDSLYQLVEGQ